ncbi:MAG: tetratricopeptide (TPR) repeat protein [Arenicella sp.]|jgi:tetratricopeptide (TPR) repeat protein
MLFALNTSSAIEDKNIPNTVKEMRAELDIVNFEIKNNDARIKRLAELLPHSEALARKNSDNAGFQMMAGFYNAQYAGYTGGIGALKYAKAARRFLEKSTALDPTLHSSSAHSVLASLYAQVPSWPIGFGDKKKALKNYQAALRLSPTAFDSNYTYAKYLYSQKKYAEAKTYLQKAAMAPARPDRPKADEYAKEMIPKLLAELNQKLASRKQSDTKKPA